MMMMMMMTTIILCWNLHWRVLKEVCLYLQVSVKVAYTNICCSEFYAKEVKVN